MKLAPFSIATLPRILFGEGRLAELPGVIADYGCRPLLVTGGRSFREGRHWEPLLEALKRHDLRWEVLAVTGEPSPELVDEAVSRFRPCGIDVVVGIGGGSAIDAAKAIAGLLPRGESVMEYLEDVGKGQPYPGGALPFIAVPTSAGTGSEATKNAVLSEAGSNGYKKSFRHEQLVARAAVIDPALLESNSAGNIAAQGMDAWTQLLESYVSIKANPFTDALAWSGLEAVAGGFVDAWRGGDTAAAREGRAAMAYGALLSGITLAQVGLGSVHGLAQPLGSLFALPHGIACGTTVAAATRVNIEALQSRAPESEALAKYAAVGRLLSGASTLSADAARQALLNQLEAWTETMAIPRLGAYGITVADIEAIVAHSRGNSMKTNPIELTDSEIARIVRLRL